MMIRIIKKSTAFICIYLIGVLLSFSSCSVYKNYQFETDKLSYERVAIAHQDKAASIKQLLKAKKIRPDSYELFIRAFKAEEVLEVWAKNTRKKKKQGYQLLKTYSFCRSSGILGPKRKEGDRQIPEGFYYIDRFNPKSSYFLSLGLNYPNDSDRILGHPETPGSDIFIHGNCVTIGCIPVTDDKIKEVFLLAAEAAHHGQNEIPVHIFPARLDAKGWKMLSKKYPQPYWKHKSFWQNLQEGFRYFEKHKQIPKIAVDKKGAYYVED